MIFDIITIFPDSYDDFKKTSIIKRAIENKIISINTHNLRDYSFTKHKNVDDTIYGGDFGMLMMFPPLYEAIKAIKQTNINSKVVIFSPKGKTFNQEKAFEYSKLDQLVLIPAHYEGFDERILDFVDEELSIGDFILTNGILPSQIVIDATTRLKDGAILKESYEFDTFSNGLLKYPEYTKPFEYKDIQVPEILISGHHENIKEYRFEQQIFNTLKKRPDLIKNKFFDKKTIEKIKKIDKSNNF